jgi:hypothetical protein
MPYSTAGATLRRANIAAGLPYATTNPRATNKSSAIACLCYARVESGDLGAKRGDDFGRRGFKPNVRTRVFCASALPVVVTLASPMVWFHRPYQDLGFAGASSHSGRRTFITRTAKKIVEAGGSLRDVQELAGHTSLSTTQRYIQGDTAAKRRVVDL